MPGSLLLTVLAKILLYLQLSPLASLQILLFILGCQQIDLHNPQLALCSCFSNTLRIKV